MDSKIAVIIAIVAGVLLVIGSLGTWASIDILGEQMTIRGTGGTNMGVGSPAPMYGLFTLLLGLVVATLAGLSLKFNQKILGIGATTAAALALIVLFIDYLIINKLDMVSINWGLYLALISAIGALAGSGLLTYTAFKRRA